MRHAGRCTTIFALLHLAGGCDTGPTGVGTTKDGTTAGGGETGVDDPTSTTTGTNAPVGPHGALTLFEATGTVVGAVDGDGGGEALALVDVDEDGREDLIALASEAFSGVQAPPYLGVWTTAPLGAHSFLDADFVITNDLPQADSTIVDVQTGDPTGDGIPDLLVMRTLPNDGSEVVVLDGPIANHRSLLPATVAANVVFERNAPTNHWQAVRDITGDGIDDLLAGQNEYSDGGVSGTGSVWVFAGPLSGRRESDLAFAQIHATVERGQIGGSLAAGDFNGDGIGDLVIPEAVEHVYVLYGPIVGAPYLSSSFDARWTFDPDGQYPTSVYTTPVHAADFDGDGQDDLAFGLQDLRVITGTIQGELTEAGVTAVLPGATDFAAGDVNADGITDVLVGDGDYNPGVSDQQGAAYLYYGPVVGAVDPEDAVFSATTARDQLGRAVGLADLTGDGYDDVAIGAPGADVGGSEAGAVLLWTGGI